jgi:hypothetical protein
MILGRVLALKLFTQLLWEVHEIFELDDFNKFSRRSAAEALKSLSSDEEVCYHDSLCTQLTAERIYVTIN